METRSIVLESRPNGIPILGNFRTQTLQLPPLGVGDILVETRILSMDTAIRGFLDDRPSYLPPVKLGEPIRGLILGKVIRSRNPRISEGQFVRALGVWSDHVVLAEDAMSLEIIDPDPSVPLTAYMGVLGSSGLTAWVGMHEIAKIKSGDTILVSAAAGGVGSLAGQIARLHDCHVIGLAGGAAKTAMLQTLGYSATIDYKAEPDLASAIRREAPDGLDVYFDNVGGAMLETALGLMRDRGRIAICGMVGQYNDQDSCYPNKALWQMVVKRLTMRGFLTPDHGDVLAEAARDLTRWVANGQIKSIEKIYEGLESAPAAFVDLMSGRTSGKTMVTL